MSFTGIFHGKDGLVAIVDSKGSRKDSGTLEEDHNRNPEKLFVFEGGVAVTYGANQFLSQNPNQLFSKKINIEDFVYEYLKKNPGLDANFFQDLLLQMGSTSSNQESIHFLVGRKIRAGEYRLEHHQIGYDYYAQKVATEGTWYFTGGEELYCLAFDQMDLSQYKTSADALQKQLATKLQTLIDFYDRTLTYNSVGGSVKSYVLR